MSDVQISILSLLLYTVTAQWAFRCQRVGRGILLLAKDSAAAHPDLFSRLMPTRFIAALWISRVLWITGAIFAWRAWGWPGPIGVFLYMFLQGLFVDNISPWPSYGHLLQLIRRRLESGALGFEGASLMLYVYHIEGQMAEGVHFEDATTGVWISRAREAAQRKGSATPSEE